MRGSEFEKTSEQIKVEVDGQIEALHRQLLSSQLLVRDGNANLLRGLLVVIVLLVNVLFSYWFEVRSPAKASTITNPAPPDPLVLSSKDRVVVWSQLGKIDEHTARVNDIKARVAPNLPIDQSLGGIRDATIVARQILGMTEASAQPVPIAPVSSASK